MPDELDGEPTTAAPIPAEKTAAAKTAATTGPKKKAEPEPQAGPRFKVLPAGGVFSGYGVWSAVLGVVSVVAVVLAVLIGTGHRDDVDELAHQSRVLQAAADWTNVLINMNSGTVAQSMKTLQEGTVGQLSANFETSVEPFSQVVQKLQSQTTGQVESVAIETIHHTKPGDAGLAPLPRPELTAVASRTDDVIVVATSVSQNAGAKPLTVHWNLRMAVSDVDGKLLISRLEPIR